MLVVLLHPWNACPIVLLVRVLLVIVLAEYVD